MRRENEDHAKLKTTSQKLIKLTIGERLMQKLKCLCMHLHCNLQDVGKNISVGFFSKENTETRCMA